MQKTIKRKQYSSNPNSLADNPEIDGIKFKGSLDGVSWELEVNRLSELAGAMSHVMAPIILLCLTINNQQPSSIYLHWLFLLSF